MCSGLGGRTVRGGYGFVLCIAKGWLSFGKAHPQRLLCGGCAGFCHPEEKPPESALSSRSRGNPYDQKIHHLKGARGPPEWLVRDFDCDAPVFLGRVELVGRIPFGDLYGLAETGTEFGERTDDRIGAPL